MKKVLAIIGPTGTGKTDLGIILAKKFNGEIISCDSRQVYKDLDIGTGKMPNAKLQITKGEGFWEIDEVKVWMYDVADLSIRYSVYDYVKDAGKVLEDIFKRGKLPIIIGGTGLYLKGLLEGLDKLGSPVNEKLREKLRSLSLEELQEKFKEVDLSKWENLNNSEKNNKRRLVRYLEILDVSIRLRLGNNSSTEKEKYDVLKIGLMAPREVINNRIDERVDRRIEQGMVDEAERLKEKGLSIERMEELGLEYRNLARLLVGQIRDVREFGGILKVKIHQYAKRQMTWFRNQEKDINWVDITKDDYINNVEKIISTWYNLGSEESKGRHLP